MYRFLRALDKWPSRKQFLTSIYWQKQFTTKTSQTEITFCTTLDITTNDRSAMVSVIIYSLYYIISDAVTTYNRQGIFKIAFKLNSPASHFVKLPSPLKLFAIHYSLQFPFDWAIPVVWVKTLYIDKFWCLLNSITKTVTNITTSYTQKG